jgi:hypothetical protein
LLWRYFAYGVCATLRLGWLARLEWIQIGEEAETLSAELEGWWKCLLAKAKRTSQILGRGVCF